MKETAVTIQKELHKLADVKRAQILMRFFKTGKGEYGEGDRFLGITVPVIRKIALRSIDLPFSELKKLLHSPWHEERLLAVLILTYQYKHTEKEKTLSKKERARKQKEIYRFYLAERKGINNWDLIDLSAPNIVGTYLRDNDRSVLYRYARSKSLWDRRIAILATFSFIRQNDFSDTLHIIEELLEDTEPLIHKANGWMLREIGKRDKPLLIRFLKKHPEMPRTTLRYAIERFPENERQLFLHAKKTKK